MSKRLSRGKRKWLLRCAEVIRWRNYEPTEAEVGAFVANAHEVFRRALGPFVASLVAPLPERSERP